MKGLLRSKLVFSLVAGVLLAGAIAIPLVSGSINHSHAQAPVPSSSLNSINSPILFIHGIVQGSAQADTSCNAKKVKGKIDPGEWGNAINFAKGTHLLDGQQISWASQPLVTVGYYTNDNCDVNLATSTSSDNCKGYQDANVGTPDESIRHIGCELAWYIYTNYTAKSQNVGVVGFSMGGLITRWALACSTASPAPPCLISKSKKNPFPNANLLVRDVVTLDTPHAGIPSIVKQAGSSGPCAETCAEFRQMLQGGPSPFLSELDKYAQNPQGAQGTDWTMIGNSTTVCFDPKIVFSLPARTSTGMDGGNKVVYIDPCYGHGEERFDTSESFNATVGYCIGCPKSPKTLVESDTYPHSLLRTLYALSELPIIDYQLVRGDFLHNSSFNNGVFDPTTKSVFRKTFPVINFNPPNSPKCAAQGVDTRPFTDVFPHPDGSCTPITAEGSGAQAGVDNSVASLQAFEAVFITQITVAQAGNVTFNVHSDDGWILAMGLYGETLAQPTYVSGSKVNPPKPEVGPFSGDPVMGAYNLPSSPTLRTVTVNFPTYGIFPVELDYTECCGGSLALNFSSPSEVYIPSAH